MATGRHRFASDEITVHKSDLELNGTIEAVQRTKGRDNLIVVSDEGERYVLAADRLETSGAAGPEIGDRIALQGISGEIAHVHFAKTNGMLGVAVLAGSILLGTLLGSEVLKLTNSIAPNPADALNMAVLAVTIGVTWVGGIVGGQFVEREKADSSAIDQIGSPVSTDTTPKANQTALSSS